MDKPKISVLIPLYNRKQYAVQCIDSALNQTFQEDYEIIIRDDCSTDGVFEFVQEKYANQISAGKIKLIRNKKNWGEKVNVNKLIRDATGKYIAFLHNDDAYLPHALQHLYDVAENFNADVVHGSGCLIFPEDDSKIFVSETYDSVISKKVAVMSDIPSERFQMWLRGEIFWDTQYNLFNRNFMIENEIFNGEASGDPIFLSLWWTMLAKVFVKTPVIFYVRRKRPKVQLTEKEIPRGIEEVISVEIEMSREFNRLFNKVELLKNNEEYQYMAKAFTFCVRESAWIMHKEIYRNGVTPEIYNAVKNTFKKYFGDDYYYPMFLFNWAHVMPFRRSSYIINYNANPAPPSR